MPCTLYIEVSSTHSVLSEVRVLEAAASQDAQGHQWKTIRVGFGTEASTYPIAAQPTTKTGDGRRERVCLWCQIS